MWSSLSPPTGTLNGSLSRPHSESSGEFSLSLDQEVWSSSGSSPVQQPTSSRSTHQSPLLARRSLELPSAGGSLGQMQIKKTASPSEVLSLQQFLDEGIDPAEVSEAVQAESSFHHVTDTTRKSFSVLSLCFSHVCCSPEVRRTSQWILPASPPHLSVCLKSAPLPKAGGSCAPPVGKRRQLAPTAQRNPSGNRVGRA